MKNFYSNSFAHKLLICCFLSLPMSVAANRLGDPPHPDSLAKLGHCTTVIVADTNCATQEITLSAFINWTWTLVHQPVVAPWSNGLSAHKITILPPGTWSWDPGGTTCEPWHQYNSITFDKPFFEGPVEITGPAVICPVDDLLELNTNLNNFSYFESLVWSPPNSAGDFEPYPITQPGTYGLTVTDPYGCSSSDQFTIIEIPLFVPLVTGPARICPEGDTATISMVNPNLYQAFEWDNGDTISPITVYSPGIYQVTVTESHGCTGVGSISIQSGEVGGFDISVSSPTLCPGLVDTLRVLGGFTNYSWSNNVLGITNIVNQAGTYTVTVTNIYGCTGTSSVTVTPLLPPVFQIVSTPLCVGDTAVLSTNGGVFPQYLWSSGATTASINATIPGTYSVTISGTGVCVTSTNMVMGFAQAPTTLIDPPAILNCLVNQTTLSGFNSSSGPNFPSHWTTPDGHFVSGDSTLNPTIDQPGTYILSIVNAVTGCFTHDTVVVTQDILPPPADAGPSASLTCAIQNLDIGPAPAPTDPDLLPAWSTLDGNILSGNFGWMPEVNQPGTYLVVVTYALNGCTSTASVVIGQDITPPTVQIAATDLITCMQGTVPLDGSGSGSGPGFTYNWSTLNGILAGSMDSVISGASSVGTYNLLVTNTLNGCTASNSVTVSADVNIPMVGALPPSTLNCIVLNTVIDASASSSGPTFQYNWTTVNGNILSGGNTLTPTVGAPGTYILQLFNAANNCAATLSVLVNQDTVQPLAHAGLDATLNCANPTTSLDGSASSTGPDFSYLWTTSDGTIVSGNNSLNPTVNMDGTYILQVTNQLNSCSATASVVIMNDANAPEALIAAPASLTCATLQTFVDASSSTQAGNLSYVWTGNILSGQGTLQPNVDQPGIYTLSITNNSNGCTDVESVTVLQDIQSPVVNAGSDDLLTCVLTSLSLQAQILSSSSQIIDYQWSTPNGQILNGANTANPIIGAPGNYWVTVTDNINGCTSTDPLFIAQDVALPTALIANPLTLTCTVQQVALNAMASSFGVNFEYGWTTPAGNFISTQNLQQPIIDEPGVYNLLITNTFNGCTQTASVTVSEDVQLPTVEAGALVGLDCDTQTNTLDGSASSQGPNFIYTWSTANGQIISGGNTLTPSIGDPGNYVLTILNTTNGCSDIDNVNVTEDVQQPVLAIAPPQMLTCTITSEMLQASGTALGNPANIVWTSNNGNILAGGNSLTPVVDAPGNYTLTVLNPGNGCSSTMSVVVTENIQVPPLQVQSAPLLTCSVLEFPLTSTVPAQVTVFWTTVDGNIVSGANTPNPTVDEPGIYLLTIMSTMNGCTNSAQILVQQEMNVPTGLHFDLAPPLCNGTLGAITIDQVDGGIGPFVYSMDAGQTFLPLVEFNNLTPGDYDLVVRDANGCEITEPITVPSPLIPLVITPPIFEIQLGENQEIVANVPTSFPLAMVDTVIWSPMTGLTFEGSSILQLLSPTAQPFVTTQYTVTIFTKEGCKSEARSIVRVDRQVDIYAPNVIRPDDPDGDNSYFQLFARDESVAFIKKLQIFDRWGSLIFSNHDFRPNDPSVGWDGRDRGELVNPGVFVWWAEVELVDGREVLLKGDVTVVR